MRLPDDNNLALWHVVLAGPANTPYANGKFGIKVELPPNYPFHPPKVNFVTRIYHPNVTHDAAGNVCIAMLKNDQWKPALKLNAVLEAVRAILVQPNPDDPLETRIADEFKAEPDVFLKQATDITKRYAAAADPFKK